jgi:phosphate uptake regulator
MSLGRSSLVISLPKHWVRSNNIKQGDIVSLRVQRDSSLEVFPGMEKKREEKRITLYIDPNEDEASIARSIISCYLNGYSSIKLVSRKIFSTIQHKAIRRIAGVLYMRVMESDSKNMRLTTLIDESKASIVTTMHRMHLIVDSMCRDALNSLKDQNADLAKTVYSLDDDVDHFCFFLLRILRTATTELALTKQLELDPIDCLDYQILVYRIEHVADNVADIAKQIIMLQEGKRSIPDSLIKQLFTSGYESMDAYDKAVNSFISKDVTACNEIIEQQKKIEKTDRKIASKTFVTPNIDGETICAICSIRDNIKRICEWATLIAENTILRSYGDQT